MTEIKRLKGKIKEYEERINVVQNFPRTRISAAGGMILEACFIKEIEDKDEQLGIMRAKLHRLENPDDVEEVIELIQYDKHHIVETYIKNGILVKGGLLERYFKGRLAEEHESYVRNRHGKVSKKLEVVKSKLNITESGEKDKYSNRLRKPLRGTIELECKIGNFLYKGKSEFEVTVDQETYFYFNLKKYDIKTYGYLTSQEPVENIRGLSGYETYLIKYVCAMLFRDKYRKGRNINISNSFN